jgi:tryptophanyl-tRNA synthetase
MSELQRMTQFKDKSETQDKNVNAGLFTYPVLQAADILLYRGSFVPVGQDQVQHVELTRDIGRWFNNKYGKYFPEAKALLTEIPKVMSLLEPTRKMSKSLGQPHVIELADSHDIIEKKLKKAVTDSGGGRSPGVENLFLLLKNFSGKDVYNQFVEVQKEGTLQYGDLKKATADAISIYFSQFRDKRAMLLSEPEELKELLALGARKAKAVAGKTMEDVRQLVGLR